jgi:hypothetical protein
MALVFIVLTLKVLQKIIGTSGIFFALLREAPDWLFLIKT